MNINCTFEFKKVRKMQNLGNVYIWGYPFVMSRTDAQNGVDIIFNKPPVMMTGIRNFHIYFGPACSLVLCSEFGFASILEYRKFDESGLCVLFVLLTFPVHATLHKMEESNHVECQDVKDVAKELLLTNCSVCENITLLHCYIVTVLFLFSLFLNVVILFTVLVV